MVKFISLSSGSNGNCYYFSNEKTAFLIDIGIGIRTLKKRLAENNIDINSIDMILVTHDHVDHIKSLGSFTERYLRPVYATSKLHEAFRHHFCTRGMLKGCEKVLEIGKTVEVNGVSITPFEVPHDAAQTLGYHIVISGERFTIMTDLGKPTEEAVEFSSKADHLIVESNYDVDMLVRGSYPPLLKNRVMSDNGHLSNEQTASLLRRCCNGSLKDVFLCHLSENNNTPEMAYREAVAAIKEKVEGKAIKVTCLPRRTPSELFIFGHDTEQEEI